nr:MAG TPA: hypothetical protein [Caudoviricetes sp.]
MRLLREIRQRMTRNAIDVDEQEILGRVGILNKAV